MRVIIIEDEEMQALNLKKLLEQKGFAVDWVDTAEKAQSRILLYRNDYSVIVCDLSLPGMSGMDLTKAIRAEGISIPLIILTGYSDSKHKVDLLNSGADDYIVKPFSPEELLARVNSVLRRPVVAKPVVLSVGGLEIDTAAHKVRSGNHEIPLTLKEYSLLECFLRRPNEVLKRADLCDQIWDFNSLTWSNVLDVHMKNLRKKLEKDEYAVHFETVRGVGYRLVA